MTRSLFKNSASIFKDAKGSPGDLKHPSSLHIASLNGSHGPGYPRRHRTGFISWLKHIRDGITLYPLVLLIQIGLFFTNWAISRFSGNFTILSEAAGEGLHIARGAAMSLNFSCAIILLPMSKWWLTKLRLVSPKLMNSMFLDNYISVHRWIGYSIVFFTVVHVIAHVFNYVNVIM